MSAIAKRCPCCRRAITRAAWDALPLVLQLVEAGARVEWRTCTAARPDGARCGSTIALELRDEAAS